MHRSGLKWVGLGLTLALATAIRAAPPGEPVEARVIEVNVAGREILSEGMIWAVESTAAIRVPGKKNASLRDVRPGMQVRLDLAPSSGAEPLVRTVTVLSD